MKVSHTSAKEGSASHNDRTFDLSKAEHIDRNRMKYNRYWTRYEGLSFEDGEKKFYLERYGHLIKEQNKKRKQPVPVEYYLKEKRYCPEEIILQIGNIRETITDDKIFDECFDEYLAELQKWNNEHGNHIQILNYAVHKDETTVHAHIRRVWEYTGKDGRHHIGIKKALEQSGLKVESGAKKSRYSNDMKATFDRIMYQKWINICESKGLEIDKTPGNEAHKKIKDYKRDERVKEIEALYDMINKHERANSDARRFGNGESMELDANETPTGRYLMDEKHYKELKALEKRFLESKNNVSRFETGIKSKEKELEENEERLKDYREANRNMRRRIEEIKQAVNSYDEDLILKAMQTGEDCLNNRSDVDQEFLGKNGYYNQEKYKSIDDAADAMEQYYTELELENEKNVPER